MSLHKTQTTFKTMILTGDISTPENTFQVGGTSLEKRLTTYQNNFRQSLSEVLSGTFQTVTALVGKDFMSQMSQTYALKNPPKKACLHDYGKDFPDFIETFPPAQSLAYLADMARIDWAANRAYHAPDIDTLSPQNMAELDLTTPDLKLALHPSVSLIHSKFAIHLIRQYVRDEDRQKNEKFNIEKKETYLLIARQNYQVSIQEIDKAEYKFLQNTHALMATVEDTLKTFPDFNFQALLQKTLSSETFIFPTTNTSTDT